MWLELLFVLALLVSAFQAIRATRLLTAAIWLAGVSVLLSIVLYRVGAVETSVIELSVGAGLVTVLFVFAIAMAGDEEMNAKLLAPSLLGWLLVLGVVGLLSWLILPVEPAVSPIVETPFSVMMWEERGLDMLVQIGLIFAGILGILGLLSETTNK